MITFWNRAEMFVGPSPERFGQVCATLDAHGIRYQTKIVRDSSMRATAATSASQRDPMYYVYVHRRDADQATGILRTAQ